MGLTLRALGPSRPGRSGGGGRAPAPGEDKSLNLLGLPPDFDGIHDEQERSSPAARPTGRVGHFTGTGPVAARVGGSILHWPLKATPFATVRATVSMFPVTRAGG